MSSETTDTESAELSRPFRVADLADTRECKIEIAATADERIALAKRYALVSLDALAAHLIVLGDVVGEIVVEGRLQAEVVQECVVTLEPVRETVDAPIDQRYTLGQPDLAADLVIGPDDMEPPEPVAGDSIDLGELVAQYLSVSLNPYPRAPDADAQADQYLADAKQDGPFAALDKLRDRGQS